MSCSGTLADAVAALLGGAGGGSCGCAAAAPLFGYQVGKEVAGLAVDAADLAPLAIPLEGVAAVRLLAFRSDGTSLKLRMSSTNGGADQVIPLSGLVVLQLPGAGDAATALSLSGTGTVEYLLAGDP